MQNPIADIESGPLIRHTEHDPLVDRVVYQGRVIRDLNPFVYKNFFQKNWDTYVGISSAVLAAASLGILFAGIWFVQNSGLYHISGKAIGFLVSGGLGSVIFGAAAFAFLGDKC